VSTATPEKQRTERRTRVILILFGLLLPTLSLVPFGSVWLWQNGYLIYWAAAACSIVLGTYLLQRRLFPAQAPKRDEPATAQGPDTSRVARELGWSPLEEAAMADVEALTRNVDLDALDSWDAIRDLGGKTIETVARRLHPGRTDPVWQFTPPEALAIIERVSRRLRLIAVDRVPFGDKITVAQALNLYRWRGTVDYFEKAWDLWRILRLANPVTAATHEVRERLSNELIQWGRDEVTRRLTEAYVREVGRAAIDLYGGRLRVTSQTLGRYVSADSAADAETINSTRAEPLRILVAGQISAGKSSLINALAAEAKAAVDALPATAQFTAYRLEREGFPAAVVIDSPGLATTGEATEAIIEKAADCDLVLWVVGAHRADRHIDQQALAAFRQHFASRLNRRRPPIVLVMTHIDKLRPFNEWSPPYDLAKADTPKAANIKAAHEAITADLGFDTADAVPVSLLSEKSFNIEKVWEHIAAALPEAMRAQLLRCLHDLKDDWKWSSLWSQTTNAGRAIAGAVAKRKR
jgi:predicted GTPase